MPSNDPSPWGERDGVHYDVEFFFDVGCPFTWQASVWIRRVAELRGITIGWRFLALPPQVSATTPIEKVEAQRSVLRYHRLCAAAGERLGNSVVGNLYRAWGERFWYSPRSGGMTVELAVAAALADIDVSEILRSLELPADLLSAPDDEAWDAVIERDTAEAFRRTGRDAGSPVITYGPPSGNSLFGPVISETPDDATAVAFYDAIRTIGDFKAFSELKRTARAALDLPLLEA